MIGPKKYIRTVKTIGDKGTKVEHFEVFPPPNNYPTLDEDDFFERLLTSDRGSIEG